MATAADSTMHIYTNVDSIVPKQHSSACARVQLFRASHAKCSNILWSVMQEFNCRGHWSHGKNCIRDCNKVRATATTQLKSPSKLWIQNSQPRRLCTDTINEKKKKKKDNSSRHSTEANRRVKPAYRTAPTIRYILGKSVQSYILKTLKKNNIKNSLSSFSSRHIHIHLKLANRK